MVSTATKQLQKPKFEYVIRVNGKEVWKGINPKQVYWEIKRANPEKRVSVAWEAKEDYLYVYHNFSL